MNVSGRVVAYLTLATGLLCARGALADAQAPDLGQLDATRSHPLFNPTRRRPPPVLVPQRQIGPAPATLLEPPTPNLQLSGVVVGTDRTVAIVKRTTDAKIVSLEVGRNIDGWTVASIRPREIELRLGTRTVTLRLPVH